MLVYTEQVWRALYRLPVPQVDGVPIGPALTYGRDYEFFDRFDLATLTPVRKPTSWRSERRGSVLAATGIAANADVILIGSAFGFLMESLIDVGVPNVWGIEPSPFVWANTNEMRPDTMARTVNSTIGVTPVTDIRAALGAAGMPNPQRANFVVDEDAISSCQSDAEIDAFLDACEALLQGNLVARIIHIVTTFDPAHGPGDTSINWKTLADWQAFRSGHTWLDARAVG